LHGGLSDRARHVLCRYPSKCMAHACSNTFAPSDSMCALKRIRPGGASCRSWLQPLASRPTVRRSDCAIDLVDRSQVSQYGSPSRLVHTDYLNASPRVGYRPTDSGRGPRAAIWRFLPLCRIPDDGSTRCGRPRRIERPRKGDHPAKPAAQ
jgi:hypothetical protein